MDQGITYAPHTAIKSQTMADFVAEWTEAQMPPIIVDEEYWVLYFDGSLMRKGKGAALVFILPQGVQMKYTIRLPFLTSNNMVEY